MPDPVGQMIANLNERMAVLEAQLRKNRDEAANPITRIPAG